MAEKCCICGNVVTSGLGENKIMRDPKSGAMVCVDCSYNEYLKTQKGVRKNG